MTIVLIMQQWNRESKFLKDKGVVFFALNDDIELLSVLTRRPVISSKKENHHHRSLCYQNDNCITVDKTKLSNIKTEEYNQILNEMQQTKSLLEDS